MESTPTKKKLKAKYVGTLVSPEAWRQFKAKAAAHGQSIASRLKLLVDKNPEI